MGQGPYMKTFIIGATAALLLAATLSSSQGNSEESQSADSAPQVISMPVCGTFKEVRDILEKYDEKIIFIGSHEVEAVPGKIVKITTVITLNFSTGQWSQWESIGNNTMCYTDGGTGGKFTPPGVPI